MESSTSGTATIGYNWLGKEYVVIVSRVSGYSYTHGGYRVEILDTSLDLYNMNAVCVSCALAQKAQGSQTLCIERHIHEATHVRNVWTVIPAKRHGNACESSPRV
jgi:hypothetical protein